MVKDKTIIATSVYSGQQWALYLDVPYSRVHIVLPFADPLFGEVKRSKAKNTVRITYAGRLHPNKGIYILLETLHAMEMREKNYEISIVMAGVRVETGQTIARMLKNYPYAKLITAKKTVNSMAQVLARTDILLVPSVYAEPFGMLSAEAQHAGCRVVASNIGGLPETNAGILTLVEPRSPRALMSGIQQAISLGLASETDRENAKKHFTLRQSVDTLLEVIGA